MAPRATRSRQLRCVSFTNPFTTSTPTSARSESTVSKWSAFQPAKPETHVSGDAEFLDLAVDRGARHSQRASGGGLAASVLLQAAYYCVPFQRLDLSEFPPCQ